MKYNKIILCALILSITVSLFGQSESALRNVTELDRSNRDASGRLLTLPVSDHILRGNIYFDNRHFAEAREHFQRVLDEYPSDPGVARALFVIGRSYMWERECAKAIPYLDRVANGYPETKDGREALAFKGACHVRLGKNIEAAEIYAKYTVMYPTGERIDSAYLNIIDALREAGRYDEAKEWVTKTRVRFAGASTEANAMHAQVRMEIFRQNWGEAVRVADEMLAGIRFAGSLTTADEIRYLKGLALEKSGDKAQADRVFATIPANRFSYYSGLASQKLTSPESRVRRTSQVTPRIYQDFPVMFRSEILRYSRPRKVDPRFVLAIMKQESSFKPGARSPAAARGLLQLVFDTAVKYNAKAGFPSIAPDDLYKPNINIAIGIEYIADLLAQSDGLYEVIAASYNAGEDNAARWLRRTNPRDRGLFAAEVGFAETKNYVAKVMANYAVYQELYDEDLNRR